MIEHRAMPAYKVKKNVKIANRITYNSKIKLIRLLAISMSQFCLTFVPNKFVS